MQLSMQLSLAAAFCLGFANAGHIGFNFTARAGAALRLLPPPDYGTSSLQLGQGPPQPPPPLGPDPQLMWIENTPLPAATLPPLPEQCYACRCLMAFPGPFLSGGNIADPYTCHGGAATRFVPEVSWTSEIALSTRFQETSSCPDCQSFAITMEDLDYPNGIGEVNNKIQNMFWAVNIPTDWRQLSMANAYAEEEGEPIITIGHNSKGEKKMELPCPHKGLHRYRVTVWALNQHLGTKMSPVDPEMDYGTLIGQLESMEMARASIVGNLKSPGAKAGGHGFLQRFEFPRFDFSL